MFEKINLCQPDERKGCSACCGLLNLADISKKNLSEFLNSFDGRKCMSASHDASWAEKFRVRDSKVHICPYQGFIDKGKPGCMVLRELNAENGRDMSIFGAGVCGDYLCPAHTILDDEYKKILVDFIDDWYLYTISVADPESFVWIADVIRRYPRVDFSDSGLQERGQIKEAMSAAVNLHAEFLNLNDMPFFHYAVSEYNLFKERFTLNSRFEGSERHREMIAGAIEKILAA